MNKQTVLVTGGAGYIGSHTIVELLLDKNTDYKVVVIDNLCNSSKKSLGSIKKITGKDVYFYQGDIRDRDLLQKVLAEHTDIKSVVHFAALKAVGESTQTPLTYYQNNVTGTLVLLEELGKAGVHQFVFSSSATVYGDPASVPITEDFPTSATNPYGQSKLMMETILKDLAASNSKWSVSILRYFNPIGAHESGLIGENPKGIPNNLMPFIAKVAAGELDKLSVFGSDYNTPDGTGVRDYIHVVDLAKGHLKALEKIDNSSGVITHNLGTGQGYSVLEMVQTFEAVTGQKVPYEIVGRRPGDIAECWANPDKSAKELGWKAKFGMKEMLSDTWRWQSNNKNDYN